MDDVVRDVGKLGLIAGWLMLISVISFVVGLACFLIGDPTERFVAWTAGLLVSFIAAPIGFVLSMILVAKDRERQWRWSRSGLRRGVATVHDLRPGGTSVNSATQELICRLDVLVPGVVPLSADYRTDIGPLDAPRFVEGASFACEVNDALPELVRVWLLADPHAGELSGRYRDFQSV